LKRLDIFWPYKKHYKRQKTSEKRFDIPVWHSNHLHIQMIIQEIGYWETYKRFPIPPTKTPS